MTISVNGLGSGLDYDTWIKELVAIKQGKIDDVTTQVKNITTKETTLSSVKSAYTALRDSLEKLNSITQADSLFNQKSATSSTTGITATVNSYAAAQNIKVSVSQLATATTAKSLNTAASYAESTTKISEISENAITEGSFSVYVDGAKHQIAVTSSSTLGDVVKSIDDLTGVKATLSADGKLSIEAESASYDVTVGSNADTTNFSNVMSLVKDTETGIYASSKSVFDTDTTKSLTTAAFALGAVTTGEFTIGNDKFTIDATTTMDSLINKINKSEDAGVSAYWDASAGKLVLESTEEGASNINIESDMANGGSNFAYIMGFTSADGKDLVEGTQDLGTNAILTINGSTITSSSNTVTSDISGLTGVTLDLKEKTTSTANIQVAGDTTKLTEAVNNFVTAFNGVIAATDNATSKTGELYGESILNSIRNRLRTMATAGTGEGDYKSLASIGITTGKIGTSVNTATNQLVVDSAALTKALTENPSAVEELFLGNGTPDSEGVITNLETVLDNSLAADGYFAKRADSYVNQSGRLTDKIERMNTSLEKYQARLEAKFSAMDEIISNLKNQASVFDSYFNKKSSDE